MNLFELIKNFDMNELKKKASETIEEIKQINVTGESGGGFVRVTINGEFYILSIEFEDNELIKGDPATFRDLIMAAYNDAAIKMKTTIQNKFPANMIPGLF